MLYAELVERCLIRLQLALKMVPPEGDPTREQVIEKLLEDELDDIVAEEIPVDWSSYLELTQDRPDFLLNRTPDDIEVWVTSQTLDEVTPQFLINMNIHDLVWETMRSKFDLEV